MNAGGIDATVALTGVLPFVVLVAALLSLPVCLLLLRLYRRAVLAGMNATAGEGWPAGEEWSAHEAAPLGAVPAPPPAPLRIVAIDAPDAVARLAPLAVPAGEAGLSMPPRR